MTDTIERELAKRVLACNCAPDRPDRHFAVCQSIAIPDVAAWVREREYDNLLALSDAAKLAHKLRTERDALRAEVEKLRAVEFMASAYRAAEEDWWEYVGADEDGTLDSLIGCEDGDENGVEGERRQSNLKAMRDYLAAALEAAKPKGE